MKYVIAVRRALRSEVGANWAAPLQDVEGLEIVGGSNPYRLRIEATEQAIEVAKERVAMFCYIEPVQRRFVL